MPLVRAGLGALGLVGLAGTGCWATVEPNRTPAPEARWESRSAPNQEPEAAPAAGRPRPARPGETLRPSAESSPGESPRLVVEIEPSQGAENARRAEQLAARSRARLRGCVAEPGTRARVVIRGVPGALRVEVLPIALATPATVECVRAALSEAQTDDVSSRGSPSDRPSGFTAQFRLEW